MSQSQSEGTTLWHSLLRRTAALTVLAALALPTACTKKDPPSPAAEVGAEGEPANQALDLWDGVPPLEAGAQDIISELTPRPGPPKPPTVGKTIDVPPPGEGPSDGAPKIAPAGPLAIDRFGPEGAQNLVDAVRVSFNEAMVPLATVEDLAAVDVPLTVTPAIDADAKWLGTRTVALQTKTRIPYSTTYEVTVPASATSIHGHALGKAKAWSFTTPALALESSAPYGGTNGLEPTITLRFNQAVQRVPALAALKVRGGGTNVAFAELPSVLTEDSTDAQREQEARVVRIKPLKPLRKNTSYTVSLPAGVFGEGPNKGPALSHTFSTYPPFKVSYPACAAPCWAGNGIALATTTSVQDPKLEEKVTVTPKVENLSIWGGYGGIQISGKFEGKGTYEVSVDASLIDQFGQTLGKDFKKRVKLGPLAPSLAFVQTRQNPAVVEKSGAPKLQMRVTGLDAVEVEGTTVTVDELHQFFSGYWNREWAWPTDRGASTWQDTFDVSASQRLEQSLDVDVGPLLAASPGKNSLAWLIARSNPYELWGSKQRSGVARLVEVTDLGIAAALDHDSGVIAVHRFSDNTGVADAKVRLLNSSGSEVWTGNTDARGLVEPSFSANDIQVIAVETDDDQAFMRADQSGLAGSWRPSNPSNNPNAFFFTDRTPYKPGETIHLVGVLRERVAGPKGGVAHWRKDTTGNYNVTNPRGIQVAKGEVKVNDLGVLALDIETKEEHGTGNFSVQLSFPGWFSSGQTFYHSIAVETFRTPEFEVKVERPSSTPLFFADTLTAEVRATYLHGAPMVNADAVYTVTRTETGFTPPGSLNAGFTFGASSGHSRGWWGHRWTPPSAQVATGTGKTTAKGVLELKHLLAAVDPPKPKPAPGADAPTGDTPPETDTPPQAATYAVAATVTDQNRQAISASGSFVVHAADAYVGLRSDRTVLKEGERTNVDGVVVDLQGERVANRALEVEVVRLDTKRTAVETKGRWSFSYETTEEPISTCSLTTRGVPATCEVVAEKPGTYVVRGRTVDDKGRKTQTELNLYVHGSDAVVWDQGARRVDLVPDRKSYEPGDTANLLVRSPFDEAEGVVLVEREGIATRKQISIRGGTAATTFTVDELWAPGVTVSALLWRGRTKVPGAPPGQDLGMPAAATGRVELDVSNAAHRIEVEVTPSAEEIEPKGKLTVELATKDADGNPVSSAIALMVVDEGVLSLMNHQTPDPLGYFITKRGGGVWMQALHSNVLPRQEPDASAPEEESPPPPEPQRRMLGSISGGYADDEAEESKAMPAPSVSAAPGGARRERSRPSKKANLDRAARVTQSVATGSTGFAFEAGAAMAQTVSLRTLFATTAYFDADVRTGPDGTATVTIDMPENLTTFRVMAVAIDTEQPDRFGSADAQVRVRKAVMLRPSLPRFANFGDAFEASVMVDNQTGEDQKVLVGTRGLNVTVASDDQKFVDIPKGESREVRFSMKTEEVGKMRLQFAAMSSAGRDATEVTVPVYYPATAEAFADYGMTDGSVARALKTPQDVLPAFGGLEVSVSSTALSGLEDSVQYLVDYPYECAEQTASRVLPIFVLGKVLDEFPIASIRDNAAREVLAARGIKKLFDKQLHDGGFGYWRNDESWPYVSTWATFALLEGKRAGFTVDEGKLSSAMGYVENFVRYGHRSRWGLYYDWTTRAFGLWLLSREKKGADLFDTVWARRDELPLYARALLLSAAQTYGRTAERDALLEQLKDAVVESPKTIHFAESRSEAAAADGLRVLMHSNTQTDAIALMALLETVPDDAIVPKVMAGIMAARDPKKGGRWGSTHTNAWALFAAARYYEVVEGELPDFTARTWLGDAFAGDFTFKGRSMTKQQRTVPMKSLLAANDPMVTLEKDGPGKLYYRMGLRYAPANLQLDAQEQGFAASRTYVALPEPGQTEPDPEAVKRLEDGSWIVKAGTNVRINLSVVIRDRASYVVVDDALPAGFEGLNPRFATSSAAAASGSGVDFGQTPSRGGFSRWWYPWWTFSHTDLRDDRMLLFADRLPAGVYTYAYTARATTIGEFQLPPIRVEAMYEPERFGHSSSSRVRVVE